MVAAALGWVGTLGTFCAYLLLWRGRLTPTSMTYALMNAAGGLLAGAASVLYGAWPSATSNFVWAALGIHTTATTLSAHSRRVEPALVVSPGAASEFVEAPELELAS